MHLEPLFRKFHPIVAASLLMLPSCASTPDLQNTSQESPPQIAAQEPTGKPSRLAPEELVELFFSSQGVSNRKDLYTGELLESYVDQPTLGETLPKGTLVKQRFIEQGSDRDIIAVELTSGSSTVDWYVYLKFENSRWKLEAVRTLALPPVFFLGIGQLGEKKTRTPDEEHRLQNMLLVKSSDKDLKAFWQEHSKEFSRLADLSKSNEEAAKKLARELHLTTVEYSRDTGIADARVGGIMDNSVGFLFVPKGAKPPEMSTGKYIYVERISEQWFIYKTT